MIDPEPLNIRPIGRIRRQDGRQVIHIAPAYVEGLLRIEHADRLQVLFWMHHLSPDQRSVLTAHPRANEARPRRGVFALRSPMRPNPIGSTVVDLLDVDGNELHVSGLDADDGSPVIDVKIAT